MTVDALLSRLGGVKQTGAGRWLARCPAHEDRSPSLSIRETDDGRVLLHDFAGCAVEEILGAAGLTFDDLFPRKPIELHGIKPGRRPFYPQDVFEIVKREILICSLIACDLHTGKLVSEADYQRLLVACGRLNEIAEAAYGKH